MTKCQYQQCKRVLNTRVERIKLYIIIRYAFLLKCSILSISNRPFIPQ